ncbi:unnamed protein product [Umbelopsis ramanniana]
MTITVSPGCSLTSFVQAEAGNAVCVGNYVETMGLCQMTAIDEQFGATCDSTGVDCVLNYAGGTSHALTCNGQSQSYSALGVSFSGTCTCTLSAAAASSAPAAAATTSAPAAAVASSSAAAVASSSVPAQGAAGAASSTQPAVATVTVHSDAYHITKSSALLAAGLVSAMLVTMV